MCNHFHTLHGGSLNIYATEVLLCFEFEFLQVTAILVHSLPLMSRKRLVCEVLDTSATHADLVQDITVSVMDCQTQNGSTHNCVFATFKHKFS